MARRKAGTETVLQKCPTGINGLDEITDATGARRVGLDLLLRY